MQLTDGEGAVSHLVKSRSFVANQPVISGMQIAGWGVPGTPQGINITALTPSHTTIVTKGQT